MYVSMSIDQSLEGVEAISTTVTIETARGIEPGQLIQQVAFTLNETVVLADGYAAQQSVYADLSKNDEVVDDPDAAVAEPGGMGV